MGGDRIRFELKKAVIDIEEEMKWWEINVRNELEEMQN